MPGPGFGSAAKYLATSMLEAGLDIASMVGSRGSVFVMEVMGRNTGWLAAATALAQSIRPWTPPPPPAPDPNAPAPAAPAADPHHPMVGVPVPVTNAPPEMLPPQ